MLPDLLGDAKNSPFHAIVTHCDASVFESKLLELIVQKDEFRPVPRPIWLHVLWVSIL